MNFQYISNIFPIVSYKGASSGLHVCDGLGNLGMKKSITVLVLIDAYRDFHPIQPIPLLGFEHLSI